MALCFWSNWRLYIRDYVQNFYLTHQEMSEIQLFEDGCQVREIYGGNSGNSGRQVRTYEMSEGTSASAYVLRPFQTLVPRFRNEEIGDWKIGVSTGVVLGVELRGRVIEVRTYLIFELKYLHDMSEVFMLSIRINKKINRKTRNKQNP